MHRSRSSAATDKNNNNTSVTQAVTSSFHCFLLCSELRFLPLYKSLFQAMAGVMPKAPGSIPAKTIFHKEPQPLSPKKVPYTHPNVPSPSYNPFFKTCHRLQKNMTHDSTVLTKITHCFL